MKVSRFKTLMAAIAITLITAPAYALTLSTPGVVGVANSSVTSTAFGNPTVLTNIAQTLLNMAANTSTPTGCLVVTQGSSCYQTGPTEYSANLSGLTSTVVSGLNGQVQNIAGLGYTWLLAKYNGPNAGYVLFYVPTFGTTIPAFPTTLWTSTNQYGISGYVAWGSTSVPDSGATLSLLGLALAGLGAFRRFVKA